MDTYNRVSKVRSQRDFGSFLVAAELPQVHGRCMQCSYAWLQAVAPKRAKLANAQAQLAEANASLQAKQQALQVSLIHQLHIVSSCRLCNITTFVPQHPGLRNDLSNKTGCSHLLT